MSALIGFWNELADVADGVTYLGWYLGPWPVPPTLLRDNQSINDVLTSTPEPIRISQIGGEPVLSVTLYGLNATHQYQSEVVVTISGGFRDSALTYYKLLAIEQSIVGVANPLLFSGATSGISLLSTPPAIKEYGILRPYYTNAPASSFDGLADYTNLGVPAAGDIKSVELSTANPKHNLKSIMVFGKDSTTGNIAAGTSTFGYAIGFPSVVELGAVTTATLPSTGNLFASITGMGVLDFSGSNLNALSGNSPLAVTTRAYAFPFGGAPGVSDGIQIAFAVMDPRDVGTVVTIKGRTRTSAVAITDTVAATLWDPSGPFLGGATTQFFIDLDHTYNGNLAFTFSAGLHGDWILGSFKAPMKLEGHPDYTTVKAEGIFALYANMNG